MLQSLWDPDSTIGSTQSLSVIFQELRTADDLIFFKEFGTADDESAPTTQRLSVIRVEKN